MRTDWIKWAQVVGTSALALPTLNAVIETAPVSEFERNVLRFGIGIVAVAWAAYFDTTKTTGQSNGNADTTK